MTQLFQFATAIQKKVESSPNRFSVEFKAFFSAAANYEVACNSLARNPGLKTKESSLKIKVKALEEMHKNMPFIVDRNSPMLVDEIKENLDAIEKIIVSELEETKSLLKITQDQLQARPSSTAS